MFAKTADNITRKLKENNTIDSEHYEICQYGLQQGLTIILNVVTTIAISVALGTFWQAVVFMTLYIPLRSNAGGYHANTASQCYLYSIFLMIAVLLVIKHLTIPNTICIIALIISLFVMFALAPVEDFNKPLDKIEHSVYRRRTLIIAMLEGSLLIIGLLLNWVELTLCIALVLILTAILLLAGKCKNKRYRKSSIVHNSERNTTL